VKNLDLDVSQVEHFSVPHAAKRILRVGALVQNILGAGNFRESPSAGYVIGMQMGVDHVPETQPVFFGNSNVQIGVVDRVAHGALSSAASAENVRSGDNRPLVEQLA
jgi:hypothetical protein